MSYQTLQQLLFKLEPERSHQVAMAGIDIADHIGLSRLLYEPVQSPVEVMGINFPNAVGLAAGLDKNAEHIDGLAALGFGFIEVGTVTPRPQPGNPKPRLFRIPENQAIINRMGFNNKGVDYLIDQVDNSLFDGVLGINIGKNFDTPVEEATKDYLYCLRKVYSRASYVTVNLSSPNTPGLRSLQFGEALHELLASLKAEQDKLADYYEFYVPIAVKIAPDMSDEEISTAAAAFNEHQIDGVIATNTTLDREAVKHSPLANEAGGLSGTPVKAASTHVIQQLAAALDQEIPIIGVGGITDSKDAVEKMQAGAALVQLYSGFIYQGPKLISDCAKAVAYL